MQASFEFFFLVSRLRMCSERRTVCYHLFDLSRPICWRDCRPCMCSCFIPSKWLIEHMLLLLLNVISHYSNSDQSGALYPSVAVSETTVRATYAINVQHNIHLLICIWLTIICTTDSYAHTHSGTMASAVVAAAAVAAATVALSWAKWMCSCPQHQTLSTFCFLIMRQTSLMVFWNVVKYVLRLDHDSVSFFFRLFQHSKRHFSSIFPKNTIGFYRKTKSKQLFFSPFVQVRRP